MHTTRHTVDSISAVQAELDQLQAMITEARTLTHQSEAFLEHLDTRQSQLDIAQMRINTAKSYFREVS